MDKKKNLQLFLHDDKKLKTKQGLNIIVIEEPSLFDIT